MTQDIRIFCNANRAIEFKQELEKSGLRNEVDYIWAYTPGTENTRSCVTFNFTNPAHATFYQLKWE